MNRFHLPSIIALMLILTLLCVLGSASAGTLGLDQRLSTWLSQDGPIRLQGTLELQSFLPFPDEKLDMFNSLLKHVAFQTALEQDGDGSLTHMQVLCDDASLCFLTENQQGTDYTLQTSLLPGRTLQSQLLSPVDLLGSATDPKEEPAFDFLTAVEEVQANYKALIDACEPFAEKKRANYRIQDIGPAKWSQIARLTPEQSDGMLPLLRSVLKSGMDPAYREELDQVRFGKGFIVALYKAGENDKDMAVYMKGDLIYPDDSICKLAYQWAFVDKGTERKDTYKYEAARSSAKMRRNITAIASQKSFQDQMSLKGSCETTTKNEGVTDAGLFKVDLSGKSTDAGRTLAGSWSLQDKRTADGKTDTTLQTFSPSLTLSNSPEGAVLSGKVKVEKKEEKIVMSAFELTLAKTISETFAAQSQDNGLYSVKDDTAADPLPASSIFQNAEEMPVDGSSDYLVGTPPIGVTAFPAPSGETSLSMDGMSEEARQALLTEMSQNLAGRLLLAFSKLPKEDIALLTDALTQEDTSKLFELFGSL